MPPTKTQRWLDLISLLLGRRVPLPVEEIMEKVPAYAARWVDGDDTARATARRTFERDKDDLKKMGIPLEPVTYAVNHGAETYEGYRIVHQDFYLPYLQLLAADEGEDRAVAASAPKSNRYPVGVPGARPSAPARAGVAGTRYPGLPALDLTAEEAELALEALRRAVEIPAFPFAAEAASALRKLTFDLAPGDFPGDPVMWVERPEAGRVLARLRPLSDALLARKRVGFTYHGIHRGRMTEREVEPYGLFFQRDWYLVARDPSAGAIRIFRVSRMEDVTPNARAPKSPDYELPADFSLAEFLDRRSWELGDPDDVMEAEVLFHYPLSLRAERNGEGEWVRDDPDGGAVRRFRVTRPHPFLRWLLSQSGEAEILAPAELREELRAMAREVVSLHAGGEVDHG